MIHIRHATVRRKDTLLLDDLCLDIPQGEHVAIIGPNGAGKSTLVKLMTKQVHPLSRPETEISLFGKSRWNVLELRQLIGIVSDDLASLCTTTYTARQIVLSGFFSSIGIDFHHQVTDQMRITAEAMMEFMEIGHLAHRAMNKLSSGENRRVLIARALVNDPHTLILDEPATSLDLKSQKAFKEKLRELAGMGKHLIMVTHDLSEIIPEIDKVIIMSCGRIAASGTKQELFTQEGLSELYGTQVFVDHHQGWYKAWC